MPDPTTPDTARCPTCGYDRPVFRDCSGSSGFVPPAPDADPSALDDVADRYIAHRLFLEGRPAVGRALMDAESRLANLAGEEG